MNIKSCISLHAVRNNLEFIALLPLGASYDDALHAVQEFKEAIETMQKNAQATQKEEVEHGKK